MQREADERRRKRRPGRRPRAWRPSRRRHPHRRRPPPDLQTAEQRLQQEREAQERSLADAQERLRQIEERTKAAERRAAEAERLAKLKSEEEERQRRLREIEESVAQAEERAREAERQADRSRAGGCSARCRAGAADRSRAARSSRRPAPAPPPPLHRRPQQPPVLRRRPSSDRRRPTPPPHRRSDPACRPQAGPRRSSSTTSPSSSCAGTASQSPRRPACSPIASGSGASSRSRNSTRFRASAGVCGRSEAALAGLARPGPGGSCLRVAHYVGPLRGRITLRAASRLREARLGLRLPGALRSPRAALARSRCGSGRRRRRGGGGRSGTSPTTAIVAAWRKSAVSKPVKVAPTIVSLRLVDDEPRGAAGALALEAGAGRSGGRTSTARASMPASSRLVERLADRRDLGVGEDDARGAEAVGDRLDLAAEHVLGRDPRLVLAHVGEQRAAVDVADRVEPVAAADPQPVVDLEEAVLAGLTPDRLEADRRRWRLAADRDEDLGRLDRGRRRSARRRPPAPLARPARPGRRSGRRPRASRSAAGDLLAGERLLARQQPLARPRSG